MYRKWICTLLAALTLSGLTIPAFAQSDGTEGMEGGPPVIAVGDPGDPVDAPAEEEPADAAVDETPEDTVVDETPEDVPPEPEKDGGDAAVDAAPSEAAGFDFAPGGIGVTLDGPLDQFSRFYFFATGGGMYDNHYFYAPSLGLQRFDLFDDQGNGEYVKVRDDLPSQINVYPGTELVLELDPAYDISIDSGEMVRNSYYLGDLDNGEWGIAERIVNVIAPESGSMTVSIVPSAKALPREIPLTQYGGGLDGGFECALVRDETSFGHWSYFETDENGVDHGTIFTGTILCFELKHGYTIEVLKGGKVIRTGSFPYPTLDHTMPSVDIQVDENAKEFVYAIVKKGEHFTIPDGASEPGTGSAASTGGLFTDVAAGVWYADPIERAYSSGIVKGVTDSTFNPNGATTRGQTVTMLYRAMGSPSAGTVFADTTGEVGSAAGWAAGQGVVNGVSSTAFSPNSSVTREQLVTMLYRMAGSPSADTSILTSYTDGGSVQSYAQSAVAWAVSAGLLTGYGDGTIRPAGAATRAEVCALIMRYLGA